MFSLISKIRTTEGLVLEFFGVEVYIIMFSMLYGIECLFRFIYLYIYIYIPDTKLPSSKDLYMNSITSDKASAVA